MDPSQIIDAAIAAIESKDGEAAIQILKDLLVTMAGGSTDPAADPAAEANSEDPDDPPEETAAALSALAEITAALGATDTADAVAKAKAIAARVEQVEQAATSIAARARVELVSQLVKAGFETPATAWKGDPKDRVPSDHLAAMSLDDLRARVQALGIKPQVKPPTSRGPAPKALSRAAQEFCARNKITPEEFETRKRAAIRK